MSPTSRFRRGLRRRLAVAIGVPALTVPALAMSSCGGKSVIDAPLPSGAGGATASSGTSAVTTTSGQVSASSVTTGSGNSCNGSEGNTVVCLAGDAECATGQKATEQVSQQLQNECCIDPGECIELTEFHCGPIPGRVECCYAVTVKEGSCVTPGRPLWIDEVAVCASVEAGNEWCSDLMPRVTDLDATTRAALAKRWVDDALMEHASVASFGRMAIALLSFAAPAEMVAACHRAAQQEITHARDAFALASAYAGQALTAGRLPLPPALQLPATLADLARETLRDGCINETIAAVEAAARLAATTDAAEQRALSRICSDESEHAALAWRCLQWSLQVGGAPVHRVLQAEAARLRWQPSSDPTTMAQVILPCLQTLLQEPSPALDAGALDAGATDAVQAHV